MPGIFGIVDLGRDVAARAGERMRLVRRMAAVMSYESTYVTHLVEDETLGVVAGRVGFAFGEVPGDRPGASHVVLTAGEPLSAASASMSGDTGGSNTGGRAATACIGHGAAAVAGHLRQGCIAGLTELDGHFAGLSMDREARRLLLFTDRYGTERIFVHVEPSRFYFASEAKAIVAVAPQTRYLDVNGLGELLSCGCTLGTRSLFREIEVLPGGTTVTFDEDSSRGWTYFDRSPLENIPAGDAAEFLEEFPSRLSDAVRQSLRTPRAALSLTGGFDSRLVAAALGDDAPAVPSYTFGSMYRASGDVLVARRVADACRMAHQTLALDRAFLETFPTHAQHAVWVSDGYLGFAGASELYLNRLAKRVAPARVTGNWGGELMRGVRAFKVRRPLGGFLRPALHEAIDQAEAAFTAPRDWHPLSWTLFHQAPCQGYGRYAVERSQLLMRSPFLHNGVVEALYRAPAAVRASLDVVLRVLAARPELAAIPTDTGRLGRRTRAAAVARQAFRKWVIKGEYLTSHGAPHWMARLSTHVPPLETAFLGRDKFQHYRHWLRHQLGPFVRDVVRSDAAVLDEWFDARRLAGMVDAHVAGRANFTTEIDHAVSLALLCRAMRALASDASAPAAVEPSVAVSLGVLA